MRSFQKYSNIGEIKLLYQQYKNDQITLKTLAKMLNVSSETIRQDFLKLVGYKRYNDDMKNKIAERHLKKRNLHTFSTIKEGIDFLTKLDFDDSKDLLKNEFFIEALKVINYNLKAVVIVNLRRIKSPLLITKNGKRILIRVGKISNTSSDYKTGHYRFKISKLITEYDYVVFVLFAHNSTISYIFTPNEISNLLTLSLRFKNLKISSKYKSALNNWELIRKG